MTLHTYFCFSYQILDTQPQKLSHHKLDQIYNKILNYFQKSLYTNFDLEKVYFPGFGYGILGECKLTTTGIILIMNFEYPKAIDYNIMSYIRKVIPHLFDPIYFNNTEVPQMYYFAKVQFTTIDLIKYHYN